MRRYPASIIYRYLDLPSTQIIRTHNSHRHNTTPPLQTMVQTPYLLPTYTTATQTQTHVQHSPCSHRIGQAQSSHPLIHSPPISTHTTPRQTHTHLTRFTKFSHPEHVFCARHNARTTCTTHMPCPLHTTTTPHPSHTPAFTSPSHSLSIHTCNTNNSHASQSQQPPHPHRGPQQPHRQTKDDHMTTDTTQ